MAMWHTATSKKDLQFQLEQSKPLRYDFNIQSQMYVQKTSMRDQARVKVYHYIFLDLHNVKRMIFALQIRNAFIYTNSKN